MWTVLDALVSEGRQSIRDTPFDAWVFQYPYAEDGSCLCKQSQIGSYRNFTSEASCLEAFKDDFNEYCSIDDGGLTDDQCDDVVTKTTSKTNMDCAEDCSAVITGKLSATVFLENCGLEQSIIFGSYVSVSEKSCFSTYVYGYGDFDPHNQIQAPVLSLLFNVPSAAKCQGLCQQTTDCVAFTWRAVEDDETFSANPFLQKTVFDFQNPARTCILYDDNYMRTVIRTPLDGQTILDGPVKYCNVPKVESCILSSAANGGGVFNPFEDRPCLVCDCQPRCVFQTGKHITGPAFCGTGMKDACHFAPPTITTTTTPTPPATCPPTSPATRPPRPSCPENCADECEGDYLDIDDCFPDC